MIALLTFVLTALALLLVFFAGFYALEIVGALLPPRSAPRGTPGPFAVIVPAHNESAGIAVTLRDIKRQLRSNDKMLVVADNCTDDTAAIAMQEGAAVIFRDDPSRRGKGYALQAGLDALKKTPPEIVLVVDADCRIEEGALVRLAGVVAASGRPAQGLYLMRAGENAPAARKASEFAWLLLNRARMQGLFTLFDVTRMTGSGMALPWPDVAKLNLASDEIVEDLALGLELIEIGAPPVFCADARISSLFPSTDEAAITQRARWEHGSLRLARRRAPGLFAQAMKNRDVRLAAAAIDLAIPPLSLFALLTAIFTLICGLVAAAGVKTPFVLALWAFFLLIAATALAWARFGREALPAAEIGALGRHLLQKVKIYGDRARASARRWTRTSRDNESDSP